MKYSVIVADVPWEYQLRPTQGAVPYPTLTNEQLIAMGTQIQALTETDAHLYFWTTNSHLPLAFDIMAAWGFRYVLPIIWFKKYMGLGSRFRPYTELLLFGERGRLPLLRKDLPNYIVEARTRHSRKPQAAYRLIEVASPGPRVELFARKRREGWHCWGNEVECDVALEVPANKEEVN